MVYAIIDRLCDYRSHEGNTRRGEEAFSPSSPRARVRPRNFSLRPRKEQAPATQASICYDVR